MNDEITTYTCPAPEQVEERFGITVEHAQADCIRAIALAAVKARGEVRNEHTLSASLPTWAGMELLQEVERQLNALIAVGAVPTEPQGRNRRLTS